MRKKQTECWGGDWGVRVERVGQVPPNPSFPAPLLAFRDHASTTRNVPPRTCDVVDASVVDEDVQGALLLLPLSAKLPHRLERCQVQQPHLCEHATPKQREQQTNIMHAALCGRQAQALRLLLRARTCSHAR